MEIVTEPDFHSALQAASFVKELQLILQALGTSNAKMSGITTQCSNLKNPIDSNYFHFKILDRPLLRLMYN